MVAKTVVMSPNKKYSFMCQIDFYILYFGTDASVVHSISYRKPYVMLYESKFSPCSTCFEVFFCFAQTIYFKMKIETEHTAIVESDNAQENRISWMFCLL